MPYPIAYLYNTPIMVALLKSGISMSFDPVQYGNQPAELSIYPVGEEKGVIGKYHVALSALPDGRDARDRILVEFTVAPDGQRRLEVLAIEAAIDLIK
jgi:hypothetical protein